LTAIIHEDFRFALHAPPPAGVIPCGIYISICHDCLSHQPFQTCADELSADRSSEISSALLGCDFELT